MMYQQSRPQAYYAVSSGRAYIYPGESGFNERFLNYNESANYTKQPHYNQQPSTQPPMYSVSPEAHDPMPASSLETQFQFSERSIRHAFIRKVYFILTLQLIVTMGIMCIFIFVDPVCAFAKKNMWVWILAIVLSIVCIFALACCEDVRRSYPINVIVLSLFTLLEGYLLGSMSCYYDAIEILQAAGITAVVCIGLTIFAFQTKLDFTMLSGILFVCCLVLLCFGIFTIFFYSKILRIVYASLGALLFSVYLVVDTQLMMGGKHKYSLSPDEYVWAALQLYIDVTSIFLYVLTLVGIGSD